MSAVQISCPSCGAAVVFKVGTGVVAVCPYCRSVVARGDRSVEDLGKVAAIVETGAVLKLGLAGHFDGVKFVLAGRTQMKHQAGGVWDEWYAAFAGGRWGWLAEAQGRYYLTFAVPTNAKTKSVPPYEDLELDQRLALPGAADRLTVGEKGVATLAGAEGEIPWRVDPGAQYAYVDLTGPNGAFATLDYSDESPTAFVGRQVTLDELGMPKTMTREAWELRQVQGKGLSCPQCGGALDLRAPDKTERIGCPHCGSLLDATAGDLRFLSKPIQLERELKPALKLGAVGKFGEAERTVIGMLRRFVTFDRIDYLWDEYLLYHPRDGFEWLTQYNNHWNHVRNVPPGEVDGGPTGAHYKDRSFRIFQRADATVQAVIGECYWKVQIGEVVEETDYIAPPLMLSREVTTGSGAKEVNWSLGEYLEPAEVKAAFKLEQDLPKPIGVAPNEPFRHKGVYLLALIFVSILLVIAMFATRTRTVYQKVFTLEPLPAGQTTRIFFTDKFELKNLSNVMVAVDMPNLTGGLTVEGDLVRDSDQHMQPFLLDMGYYSGVEDGEAWTEGSKSDEAFLSSQGSGTFSLRLEAEPEGRTLSGPINVKVEQGVTRTSALLLALFALLVIPIIVVIYHIYFSVQRWKESAFSPFKMERGSSSVDIGGDD
jgi:hypothetical protein